MKLQLTKLQVAFCGTNVRVVLSKIATVMVSLTMSLLYICINWLFRVNMVDLVTIDHLYPSVTSTFDHAPPLAGSY